MRLALSLPLAFKARALVTSSNLTALLATLVFPALAADPDPCRLLAAAEIASKLGNTPSGAPSRGRRSTRTWEARRGAATAGRKVDAALEAGGRQGAKMVRRLVRY